MKRRRPSPMYAKPPMVPATAENVRAFFDRLREPDPLGRVLDEQSKMLRVFLRREGLRVTKRLPPQRPGVTTASVDGGFVAYRKADVHPAVIEAVEALGHLQDVRRDEGDLRVLAAMSFGAALERAKATARWAGPLEARRSSLRNLKNKPTLTDDQIEAALREHRTKAEAAAALGIGERWLYDLRMAMRARNRKSVRPPTRK